MVGQIGLVLADLRDRATDRPLYRLPDTLPIIRRLPSATAQTRGLLNHFGERSYLSLIAFDRRLIAVLAGVAQQFGQFLVAGAVRCPRLVIQYLASVPQCEPPWLPGDGTGE